MKKMLTHESAIIKSLDPLFSSLIQRCALICDVVPLFQTLPYEKHGSSSNILPCHPLHCGEITCTLTPKFRAHNTGRYQTTANNYPSCAQD